MSNIYNKYKKHWSMGGSTESEEYLNESIENFNALVDNLQTPTCHKVEYTLPLGDINEKYTTNVLISDVNRLEQVKDLKFLHVKLDSTLDSGSYIIWNGETWLVSNQEYNAVQSHKSYFIIKCGININVQLGSEHYNFPIVINNLTLYSDGSKELVNLTVSSAKYTIQIAENDITNTIEVGSRFIIRGRAFEVSLIDDFTNKNIRTLTVCETVVNSLDDLVNDKPYNGEIKEETTERIAILGNDAIFIGETAEYTCKYAYSWRIDGNSALKLVLNDEKICKVKCKSDNELIGTTAKIVALDVYGFVVIEKTITIRGLF